MRSLLITLLLVVSACAEPASDGFEAPIGETSSTLSALSEVLTYRCGSANLGPGPVDLSGLPDFAADFAEMMPDSALEEYQASLDWWESFAWSVVDESGASLVLIGHDASADSYADAVFDRINDRWQAAGWGDCRIAPSVTGFGLGTVELDFDDPPDPTSNRLALLITERNCANGKEPTGREVRPVVEELADRIEVMVLIETISGDATCPGNPSFPITVTLNAPIGDRVVVDVSSYPGTEQTWPPDTSEELDIYLAGDAPEEGTVHVFAWSGEASGALLVGQGEWQTDPTWVQSFARESVTITAFVATCDGCEEECEGEACDALERRGEECAAQYEELEGHDTIMVIEFSGTTCAIDVRTELATP